MPTGTGGETIGEQLVRKRTELARVRRTIERAETNGQSFSIGGTQVTQMAYANAQDREKKLEREIRQLERRISGSPAVSGTAQTLTKVHS